jgi:hypothetical protein
MQWVFFALGLVSSGAIALVLSDCLRTTLRMRRMAREAELQRESVTAQDFSSDMVRQRTGADDARGDVACGSGVSARVKPLDAATRLGETPTSNDLRAAYCARCRRVAFLGESILCPACDELRKSQSREDAKKGGAR